MSPDAQDHPDALDAQLAELAIHDVDALRRERIRRLAHAELRRPRFVARRVRQIRRTAELVLAFGIAAGTLIWAAESVLLPYR